LFEEKLEKYYFARKMAPAEVLGLNSTQHNCYMSDQTFMNYVPQKNTSLALADIGYHFNHTLAPAKSSHRFRSHNEFTMRVSAIVKQTGSIGLRR